MIFTTKEKALELSVDKKDHHTDALVWVCQSQKGFMAAAVIPAAEMALKNANIKVSDLAAVKTTTRLP